MDQELFQILEFTKAMHALKKIERFKGQVFFRDYPQPERWESVADHTWRMTALLMLLHDRLSQPIDLVKAFTMIVIHDVPEILAGDEGVLGEDGTGYTSHVYNKDLARKRHASEKDAAKQLFDMLPETLGNELFTLWLEFEERKTYEAKIVKALDRIEGKLQVLEHRNGHVFPKHHDFNITFGQEITADADPALEQFMKIIVDEMKENFREFVKET